MENILEENPADAKIIERNDIEIYKNYKIENSLFGDLQLLNNQFKSEKLTKAVKENEFIIRLVMQLRYPPMAEVLAQKLDYI